MLISASADGTICVWDPSANLPSGAEKEIKAKISFKAHPDGVLAMALFQPPVDTPDAQPVHLCTSGVLLPLLWTSCCALPAGLSLLCLTCDSSILLTWLKFSVYTFAPQVCCFSAVYILLY